MKKIKMMQVPVNKFRRPGFRQSFKWDNKEIVIESTEVKRHISDELSCLMLKIYFVEKTK